MISREKDFMKPDERVLFSLRGLYESFGYTHYKMSKFEEYDLYVGNKDFLSSSGIITFTDTNGRLMALKPDVTLSIIKNLVGQTGIQKVFYNKNVYRVSKNSGRFREIMQTGLECVGDIGIYEISETLLLALKSLEITGAEYKLDIAHMGILSELISMLNLPEKATKELLTCIKRKNSEGVLALCKASEADERVSSALSEIIGMYGEPEKIIPRLRALVSCGASEAYVNELEEITNSLSSCGYKNRIGIDFSVVNDMSYYNGIVFRGYVSGAPDGVLSGGSYGLLLKKMGRSCGGIGFAISLDGLERLYDAKKEYDYDALLIYKNAKPSAVLKCVSELSKNGTVYASREEGSQLCAKKTFVLGDDGVMTEVKTNA